METVADQRTLHLEASERIRTVEHDHGYPEFCAAAHHEPESGDESIGAAPYVLYVVDHDVHSVEHLRRWLAGRSVEGVHGKPGALVHSGFDFPSGIYVPPDSMLGSIQGHQFHIVGRGKDVDGRIETAVDAGRVGHKSDAQPFEHREASVTEHFDARLDPCARAEGRQQRRRANQVTETVAIQHIITIMKNPT